MMILKRKSKIKKTIKSKMKKRKLKMKKRKSKLKKRKYRKF